MSPDASPNQPPSVAALAHRLARCPKVFLAPPKVVGGGSVDTAAVVCDLVLAMGGRIPLPKWGQPFAGRKPTDGPWLQLVQVVAWLLHDPWFRSHAELLARLGKLLHQDLAGLAGVVTAAQCVLEPDRREELVRFCLAALQVLPRDETARQAADRLSALDSVERVRVMRATRKAEAHARKVREAMKKRRAKEAAAKVMRE